MGNIGNQLYLEPFAGNSGTDCFFMLGLHVKKLGFRLSESTIPNSDRQTSLKAVKLLFEMLQVSAVLP